MHDFSKYGIKIPTGSGTQVKTICPICTPHLRKPANRNSKDLSVDTVNGVWNCHNCGWKGGINQQAEKTYIKPPKVEVPLSEEVISYFKSRKINEATLKHFEISEKYESGKKWILFPFVRDGEWVNIKQRSLDKDFRLTKDAELTLFHFEGVAGKKRIAITEGEIDAMSIYEAGFFDVCSVPNGASKGNQRLEWLGASLPALNDADDILLCTDADDAGNSLKMELIRRLGRGRCLDVTYPEDCKDMNDVLVKYGAKVVFDCLNNAKRMPVEGVHRLSDFRDELEHIYEYGFDKGVKIGYPDFDELLNFSPGQLTVVTGVPNSGKSGYIDQVLIRLAQQHGWNIGVCSFENQPIPKHIANLAACYIGKPYHRYDVTAKMSYEEKARAQNFLHDHFFWFKMKDEDMSCDGILERGKQLVKVHGIKALVIDPYNYMEHKRPANQTETEYISNILTDICNFSKEYGVHTFLVAHPTKIKKNPQTNDFEVPTLYDISGSAHFFNKSDNGVTVYRDRKTNLVTVYVQKVRFFYNGKIGSAEFTYDVHSGRYTQYGPEVTPPEYDNPYKGIKAPF